MPKKQYGPRLVYGPEARSIVSTYPELHRTMHLLGIKQKYPTYVGWEDGAILVSCPDLMQAWLIPLDLIGNEDIKQLIQPIKYQVVKPSNLHKTKLKSSKEYEGLSID